MIKFKLNEPKVLEVVLWLARAKPGIDFYRLLKVLFLADKWHLNTYGRPIAGERYVAMEHGPVAETAYKMLRQDPGIRKRLGIAEYPFDLGANQKGQKIFVFGKRDPDLAILSKSDVKALELALRKYGSMHFNALKALTHEHPSYQQAWQGRGNKGSVPIRYEDILEGDNATPEALEELEYVSRFTRA